MISVLKDLQGMNEGESIRSWAVIHSIGVKSYIKYGRHGIKGWTPVHKHLHLSPELTFDPGDFICDLPKIVARGFDHGFGGRRIVEAELDLG